MGLPSGKRIFSAPSGSVYFINIVVQLTFAVVVGLFAPGAGDQHACQEDGGSTDQGGYQQTKGDLVGGKR